MSSCSTPSCIIPSLPKTQIAINYYLRTNQSPPPPFQTTHLLGLSSSSTPSWNVPAWLRGVSGTYADPAMLLLPSEGGPPSPEKECEARCERLLDGFLSERNSSRPLA